MVSSCLSCVCAVCVLCVCCVCAVCVPGVCRVCAGCVPGVWRSRENAGGTENTEFLRDSCSYAIKRNCVCKMINY